MLASVLRSETAIRVSIRIMDAFVSMRHFLINNADVFRRLSTIEYHQLEMMQHQQESDKRIDEVFRRLDEGTVQPKQGIFYDGQVYDAYTFVSELVKSAKRSIVLIDNYVKVHLVDGTSVLSKISLRAIEEMLPQGGFIRIHRSFLVSRIRITDFTHSEVILGKNGIRLPIGKRYMDDVISLLNE